MALLRLGHNLWLPYNPDAYLDSGSLGHTWLIGQTGKSALLESLATQLAYENIPFAFIDPLSTSMPYLLKSLPKRWIPETVYFDPFDPESVLPWNPLEDLALQQEKVASALVALFKKMLKEGAFEGRSQDILRMSILALQGIDDATFLHIERILNDDQWRRLHVVPKLMGSVRRFWEIEYEGWIKDRQRSMSIAAPQNKLRIFTTSTVLTDILCAKERLSPKKIVQSKIFLCDLDAQRLGEIEATVLASLLLARLALAAEKPYIVFIDNVEYISPGILGFALKSKLQLVLAHRYGSEVDMSKLMASCQNKFVFQVGDDDARRLETVFPANVQLRHLVDQRPFTCFVKLGQQVLNLETFAPYATYGTTKTPDSIREQSRERYQRSRAAVREYRRSLGVG
jgi:hypothetical protein